MKKADEQDRRNKAACLMGHSVGPVRHRIPASGRNQNPGPSRFHCRVHFTLDEEKPLKRTWMVQIDGSTTKKVGVGVVLISPEGEILKYVVRLQFLAMNNEAEYETLLTGLRLAKVLEAKVLIIQANSQLVIGQVRGDYEAKEERM